MKGWFRFIFMSCSFTFPSKNTAFRISWCFFAPISAAAIWSPAHIQGTVSWLSEFKRGRPRTTWTRLKWCRQVVWSCWKFAGDEFFHRNVDVCFFFFRGIATRELEGVDSAKIGKKWTSRVRNAIIADISHRIHVWYTYLPIKKSTIHGSVYIFTWILYWFLILHIIWLYSKRSEKSPTWTWQGMKTLWFRSKRVHLIQGKTGSTEKVIYHSCYNLVI